RDPTQVVAALNETYQMENHHGLYFTLWYGVFQPASRKLAYCCAGHPPAVLMEADSRCVQLLKAKGRPIGLAPGGVYACETIDVAADSRLYLFSDGVFEVQRPDGTMTTFDELLEFMKRADTAGQSDLDQLFQHLLQIRGGSTLEDDFSIVRFAF